MSQVFWQALYVDYLILSQQLFKDGGINTPFSDDRTGYFLIFFHALFSVHSIFMYINFLTSV